MLNQIENANGIEDYFENLYAQEGKAYWLLGLYMSKRWIAILEGNGGNDEATLLMQVLDAESPNQGSGWADLRWQVRQWLDNHNQ